MTVNSKLGITEGQWENTQPSNLNYLRPNGFKFQIQNLPNVSYFCQAANIPSISLGDAPVATPLSDLHIPGDKLVYGEVMLRFLVQESMANYIELYNWMIGLGFPNDRQEYTDYMQKRNYRFPAIGRNKQTGLANYSDADLFILNADNNPCVKFTFYDAYPSSLQSLEFDVGMQSADQYLVGMATFRYRHFSVNLLTT
jgi:hypothetical protein